MSAAAAVAVVATAGAGWLLGPVRVTARPGAGPARAARWLPPAAGLALASAAAAGAGRGIVVLLLIGALTALAGARLWRRRAKTREAEQVRACMIELCATLQVELTAGQPPADALALAAADWPAVAPAARTARSGGDVPEALRRLARTPGAADLRVVAAAWQVAHRTGHGLADSVGRVAAELRAAEQTRRAVAGELASARATARLVAALPLGTLLLGTGAGSDSWAFLVGGPLGWACLASGLACGLAGLTWIEALAVDVERHR